MQTQYLPANWVPLSSRLLVHTYILERTYGFQFPVIANTWRTKHIQFRRIQLLQERQSKANMMLACRDTHTVSQALVPTVK